MSLILIRNFKFGFISLPIHSISANCHNCCERCRHTLLWKSGVFTRLQKIWIQMVDNIHQSMKQFNQRGCENQLIILLITLNTFLNTN